MAAVTDMRDVMRVHHSRRDLAWVIRLTGRLLMTAGLLVAGFVAYQLVVTDILAERGQAGLTAEFETRAVEVVAVEVPYRADSGLPPSPFAPEPVAEASGEVTIPVEPSVGVPEAIGPSSAVAPMILSEPLPEKGEALGRITIEAAGVDWTVVEGVARSQLRTGTGHMPGTPLPGQPGNSVISGHRTTYGAPFAHLDAVSPGDMITVETAIGVHTYAAVETRIVSPRDVWVVDQWDGAWLTLTTCHPRFSATERLVVVAQLVDGPNAAAILGVSS